MGRHPRRRPPERQNIAARYARTCNVRETKRTLEPKQTPKSNVFKKSRFLSYTATGRFARASGAQCVRRSRVFSSRNVMEERISRHRCRLRSRLWWTRVLNCRALGYTGMWANPVRRRIA